MENVVTFFSGKKEYRSLSNFWEKDVVIDGKEYESGEHAFHGEKYTRLANQCTNSSRKRKLLDYGERFLKPSGFPPSVAKQKGGKRGLLLTSEELETWSTLSTDVQHAICRWKMMYEEVRQDLAKSGNKILVHPKPRYPLQRFLIHPHEVIWEGRAILQGDDVVILGKNKLGYMWMEYRKIEDILSDEPL
jgi:predicted NAD-dependent protein-ADP-ribosyltransferase YbiA (DUF1768 family)